MLASETGIFCTSFYGKLGFRGDVLDDILVMLWCRGVAMLLLIAPASWADQMPVWLCGKEAESHCQTCHWGCHWFKHVHKSSWNPKNTTVICDEIRLNDTFGELFADSNLSTPCAHEFASMQSLYEQACSVTGRQDSNWTVFIDCYESIMI